ncbi:MAG TPA: protein kinase [Polyangiaceae bacterium]|jgi:serine/threonine-protein kinase
MFPQIFGKYVLEREIAAGGMARVYLGTLRGAVGFEKRLVVKQIRPELASDSAFVTRFVDEAKTAVELSHPNIVPVYELGVEQGVYYIAMEFCEGLTLSEVIAETGPLSAEEGAYLGVEICRGLDYAHRRAKIVHRDVTPRNVLIDDEGAVRLIDFGIAAPAGPTPDGGQREVFGSPGHMPPEQLRGAELGPTADVFAVGALLIEAWTGYPPFRRATAEESERALQLPLARVDRHEPKLEAVAELMATAVALAPEKRPSDAEQLARPLREFLRSEDMGDVARRLGARVQRARRRSRSSSPWLPGEVPSSVATPRVPSSARVTPLLGEQAASPVTKTFAAREDIEVWTRRLSTPPPDRDPAETPDDETSSDGVEPPAISANQRTRPARRTLGTVFVVGLAALVGIGVGVLARRAPIPPPPISTASTATTQAVSSAPIVAPAAPVPAFSADTRPSSSPRPPAISAARPSSAHSAEPLDPSTVATLKLTADPRATVHVDGARIHEVRDTPVVELKVPFGQYQITFQSQTLGRPLSTQIFLVAGASRSVHADFREAEPTLSIH